MQPMSEPGELFDDVRLLRNGHRYHDLRARLQVVLKASSFEVLHGVHVDEAGFIVNFLPFGPVHAVREACKAAMLTIIRMRWIRSSRFDRSILYM